MNDEILIWEAYENSKNPWDDYLVLQKGVNLSDLTVSQLSEYLDLLDYTLNNEANKKEWIYIPKSNDPQEEEEPRYATDTDIDDYLKIEFRFGLKDLEDLNKSGIKDSGEYDTYFGKIGLGVRVDSILKSVTTIVEYELNVKDYDGDDDGMDDRVYDYNPYER